MIFKYLASLALVVLLLSIAASKLPFAMRSQVLSGEAVDETWQLEFTLDADSSHTYEINPLIQKELEYGITFVPEGPVRILSSSVDITPKDVSWSENRERITSTGAGLLAHVKWDTPKDSANGSRGLIYIKFPEISNIEAKGPTFHSGGYQKDGRGRDVLREVTTYQSTALLSIARLVLALAAGLPFGILVHCIFWGFQLRNEKRVRLAAFGSQSSQLPRTFYTNPILEWSAWTFWTCLGAFMAGMVATFVVYDGFISAPIMWVIYIILLVGAIVASISAYFIGRSALTIKLDSNGISYARGREASQWLSAAWTEILLLTQKSKTYRGNRREWLEIEFKDKRKMLKLAGDIEGYPILRDLLFQIFKS